MTMDGHTFISWNIPNFITIALMALVLMAVMKFGGAIYQQKTGG